MIAAVPTSRTQSAAPEYDIFWQQWPQFDGAAAERRLVGVELELIGSHTHDLNHVDPTCRTCHKVRIVLLGIADFLVREAVLSRKFLTYDIDAHSNSVLCLPAWGNRSAVSVSLYLHWNHGNGEAVDSDLMSEMKMVLARCGIHQR